MKIQNALSNKSIFEIFLKINKKDAHLTSVGNHQCCHRKAKSSNFSPSHLSEVRHQKWVRLIPATIGSPAGTQCQAIKTSINQYKHLKLYLEINWQTMQGLQNQYYIFPAVRAREYIGCCILDKLHLLSSYSEICHRLGLCKAAMKIL